MSLAAVQHVAALAAAHAIRPVVERASQGVVPPAATTAALPAAQLVKQDAAVNVPSLAIILVDHRATPAVPIPTGTVQIQGHYDYRSKAV